MCVCGLAITACLYISTGDDIGLSSRLVSQILPNVFLGPYGSAKDLEAMQSKGVSHVLIVRSTLERRLDAKFPTLFKYHIVEVPEGPTENLILFFTGILPVSDFKYIA